VGARAVSGQGTGQRVGGLGVNVEMVYNTRDMETAGAG